MADYFLSLKTRGLSKTDRFLFLSFKTYRIFCLIKTDNSFCLSKTDRFLFLSFKTYRIFCLIKTDNLFCLSKTDRYFLSINNWQIFFWLFKADRFFSFYVPFEKRGAYCFAPVSRSVDQAMLTQYLLTPLLESCRTKYNECP